MSGAAAGSRRQSGILEAEEFALAMPAGARLMGLDVGSKTLGLALSDVTRTIASGLTTLSRTKFSADARRLGGFVVGLPVNLDGSEGPRAQATRAFARSLGKLTPIPILLWDERLSTAAAERTLLEADMSRRRRAQVIDKVAATLILQGALNRLKLLTSARAGRDGAK